MSANAPTPQNRTVADLILARELAKLQAVADLDAAKSAADYLDRDGLYMLRAWIDARLGAIEEASDGLSARESEVMRLIALGYSNKEIAARLKVSVKTVETHKTRSLRKLGIRSRAGIVQYALRRGWISDSNSASE